jgi:hypothetical protein
MNRKDLADFYRGLTSVQKRHLSLVGLYMLQKAFDGNPLKILSYLKALTGAPS